MKKKHIFFTILLAVLFISISLYPKSSTKVRYQQLLGQSAPDIILSNDGGGQVAMRKYFNGQPAILFFWATWCPHCRTQLKEINHNIEEFEQKGIKVILVNVGETKEKVLKYKQQNGIDLMVLLDQQSKAAELYHISRVANF